MMKFVPVVFFLLILVGIVFAIGYSPTQVTTEYATKISVETPDKIHNAISNIVFDLEKRDFVPVYLEVKWCSANKTYEISAGGIDRTKLSKYEP